MADLKPYRLEIRLSLPGRLRINISWLLRNKQIALSMKNILTNYYGIFSVVANKNTGNVLIYYDTDYFDENKIIAIIKKFLSHPEEVVVIPNSTNNESFPKILFNTLNPISLFKKKYDENMYENEYMSSKKIINTSIILSTVIFIFTRSIAKVFSMLFLGYPGILFTIGITSHYFASTKLKQNDIYLKNSNSFKLLNNTNTLLIKNDFFQSNRYRNNTIESHLNKNDIQKLVILGKLDNPINSKTESVIYDIRTLGINNIFIVGNDTNGILDYISYHLGINILDINELKNPKKCLVSNKTNNIVTLLTTDESAEKNDIYDYYDLIICIYKNNTLNVLKADINFQYTDIDKLPLIMKLSRFCDEVNVQTENIAIALNTVGMLLVALNYLTPLYSTIFYGLNTLFMTLTLKLRFIFYKDLCKECDIKYKQITD